MQLKRNRIKQLFLALIIYFVGLVNLSCSKVKAEDIVIRDYETGLIRYSYNSSNEEWFYYNRNSTRSFGGKIREITGPKVSMLGEDIAEGMYHEVGLLGERYFTRILSVNLPSITKMLTSRNIQTTFHFSIPGFASQTDSLKFVMNAYRSGSIADGADPEIVNQQVILESKDYIRIYEVKNKRIYFSKIEKHFFSNKILVNSRCDFACDDNELNPCFFVAAMLDDNYYRSNRGF